MTNIQIVDTFIIIINLYIIHIHILMLRAVRTLMA